MSSKLIAEAIKWATSSYNRKSEETLKSIISRWPKGTSPSLLVDKTKILGEGKIGHIAKRTDEKLYQLLREVHHGSSKGKELDPEGKWTKVGMGLIATGGIPGVGVYSNMSRASSAVGSGVGHAALGTAGFLGRATLCLGGYCRGGKRRATRRGKRSNRTKKSRSY